MSIVPRGDSALGYTITLPEGDRYLYSEEELRGRLVTLMAGRAAERMVFRRVTSGASDDLQARSLARSPFCGTSLNPEAIDLEGINREGPGRVGGEVFGVQKEMRVFGLRG